MVVVLVPAFGTGGRCGCPANEAAAVAVGLLLEVTNRRTALFQVLSFLSLFLSLVLDRLWTRDQQQHTAIIARRGGGS